MELFIEERDLIKSNVFLSHKGEVISWNITPFERTELKTDVNVFKQINGFWAKKPIEVQDKIFEIYKKIWSEIENINEINNVLVLIERLQPYIKELIDNYHQLSDIENWVIFNSDIIIPPTIQETVEFETGYPVTMNKTYLRADYIKLVSLAIALRAMVPIWGDFIFKVREESGTNYKEYNATLLLEYTHIKDSDAVIKLLSYIENQLPPDNSCANFIISGSGSIEYLKHMLSRVLVRRLCIGDISGISQQSTILTFIYKFIRQKNSGQKGTTSSSIIRNKFPETTGDSDEGENRLSKLEGYRIQEQLSRGTIAIIRHYLNDPYKVIKVLDNTIPQEMLDESLESVAILYSRQIDPVQVAVLQWVLKPAISPKGLATVNKLILMKAIAIVQTFLWYRGYHDLAFLCGASPVFGTSSGVSMIESRSRISKELQEEIKVLFPFTKKTGGSKSAKIINPALQSIELVAEGFCSKDWSATLPERWYSEEYPNVFKTKRYTVPFDIKNKIAQLIVDLARRNVSC